MGGSSSSPLYGLYGKDANLTQVSVDQAGLRQLFGQVPSSLQSNNGVTGGDDSDDTGSLETYTGGYDQLQKYGDSVFSRAKEKLIRDIAADIFQVLKVPGAGKAQSAPINEVINHLQKVVPNPRKGKGFTASFNKSSGKQSSACHAIANAINKNYGSVIVPLDISENDMCNRVNEVMASLFTGLHTEFMAVAGDVLRIVRNLETLKEFISASYRRQADLVAASGDEQLKIQSANVEDFYNKIKNEIERQLALLTNLLNVSVGPTGKSLIGLLEDNRDFSGLVRDLKADLGTSAFGDKLAYLLSGVSSVAHAAEIIDKALKKIGMSVGEFKSAKGLQELRLKIYDHIQRKSPSSAELDKMMHAANLIYTNDTNHKAISDLLGKKGRGEATGGCGCEGGDADDIQDTAGDGPGDMGYADPLEGSVVGGVDEDDVGLTSYWSKKSLSTKIAKKEKYRDLLLKDFRKLLRTHYRNIVEAGDHIAKRIGNEIPVTDDLYRFVDVFQNVPSIDSENIHIALSGYPKDSVSRQERDTFMNKYHLLMVALEPLMKGQGGNYFKNIHTAAGNLVKAIDNFSDKMVKSITEIHVDRPEDIKNALRTTASSFFGAGADGGGGDEMFGTGSYVDFDKIKMEMKYFLSIYNIKTNLSRSAEEMKDFGDDYEQILGEEAGWMINNIKREYLALIDDANPDSAAITVVVKAEPAVGTNALAVGVLGRVGALLITEAHRLLTAGLPAYPAPGGGFVPALAVVAAGAATPPLCDAQKAVSAALFNNLKELYVRQMNAKIRMVEVAQAIDLYLRSFADGIARHPDSIKSVVKMLDQVEIVAKWFTDRSGNNLAALFEFFPNGLNGAVPGYSAGVGGADAIVNATGVISVPFQDSPHYYHWLERTGAGAANDMRYPGNPFMGRPLDNGAKRVNGLLTLSEKTIKSMRALENILSAFATVGSKFGDLDPQAKTFMNPGQIFNSLCEYINVSAFTTGFGDPTAADTTGQLLGGYVAAQLNAVNVPSAGQPNRRANGAAGWGLITGVDNANAAAPLQKYTSIAMSAIPNDSDAAAGPNNYWTYHDPARRDARRNDAAGWMDRFFDTDMLFQMTVKSIVCKVFTVVDAYRLFNRPLSQKNRDQYDSLTPLRTILGGADGGGPAVKVIPEALELYVRLPLLAEWYRDKFNFKRGADKNPAVLNGQSWELSMVPSIDGIWSDFIALVFDKAQYVEDGNYSEPQLQKMITEMNDIFKHYKTRYPKSTVRNIINSFVVEVNRAYGFVMQKDIDKYVDERRKYLEQNANYTVGEDKDFNQFDILGSEDQFGRAPAPSDKYVTVAERQKVRANRNMVHLQTKVVEIRKRMDAEFRDYTNRARMAGNALPSFVNTLRSYKKELENARGDKEQYEVVLRLMQGATTLNVPNVDKLIMVHEAVAAPLAVVFNAYKVMAKYNALLHGASLVNLEGCMAAVNALAAGGAAAALIAPLGPAGAGAPAAAVTQRDNYSYYLRSRYSKDASPNRYAMCDTFVEACLGSAAYYNASVGGAGAGAGRAGYFRTAPAFPGGWAPADIDHVKIIRDILSAILDLAANPNGLVRCNVALGGAINIDWSPLEEMTTNLLQQVKNNIANLRIEFAGPAATNILDKYEDKAYRGSVRWLEENLVEILLKDRDNTGLPSAHTMHLRQTIEKATDRTVAAPYGTLDNAIRALVYYAVNNRLLNDGLRNDLTTFPFNVLATAIDTDVQARDQKTALQQLRASAGRALPAGFNGVAANTVLTVPAIAFTNADMINSWNLLQGAGNEKSLMMTFNKLVHQYLYVHVDDGTLKIYTPLFESFMNSVASQEVIQNKSFPNVVELTAVGAIDQPYGANILGSPPPNTILFASTALTMKALMTNIDKLLKKKRHVYDSLAEVPEYMKERMKCNLPLFSKMFQLIFDRADLLRRIINTTTIGNNITALPGARVGVTNLKRGTAEDVIGNIGDNRAYLDGLLAHLCDLTLSLKKCSDGVYKELQDTAPYFMELSRDFINDYKSRYGVLPLMPASNVLLPQMSFNGNMAVPAEWVVNNSLLLPTKLNGSNSYKFNLASRMLLARPDVEPQLDHMPGAKDIYNAYANVAQKHSIVNAAEYGNTLKLMVKLSKFLNDGAVYGRLFDHQPVNTNVGNVPNTYLGSTVYTGIQCDSAQLAVLNTVAPANAAIIAYTALVLAKVQAQPPLVWNADRARVDPQCVQFGTTLTIVLNYVENSNRTLSKQQFATQVSNQQQAGLGNNRGDMRVHNILDMNIVPINVHAFMKEVPFINILNYSYTFDRMVHDFILPSYVQGQALAAPLGGPQNLMIPARSDINNTRELFVKLLVHPYSDFGATPVLKAKQYYALLSSLFNGNDDLKLGRPRYLSDQLWHKVLLTSSVQMAAGQHDARHIGAVNRALQNQFFPALMAPAPSGPAGYEAMRSVLNAGERAQPRLTNLLPLGLSNDINSTEGLKYWDKDNKRWRVKNEGFNAAGAAVANNQNMVPADVIYCAELGMARFNTKLVRNLTWLVQLQRIMRVVLINHLSWLDTPVVRGLKIADPVVTEFNANDSYNNSDFTGENYNAL